MKQPNQALPEPAAAAVTATDAVHAHTWLNALAESFVIEIADDLPGAANPQKPDKSGPCTHTVQLEAWWTRLI